eukprot:4368820-Prymnesium_polylepis.1
MQPFITISSRMKCAFSRLNMISSSHCGAAHDGAEAGGWPAPRAFQGEGAASSVLGSSVGRARGAAPHSQSSGRASRRAHG